MRLSLLHLFLLISVPALPVSADDFAAETSATPPSAVTAPPGFQVRLLRSAQPADGSWISMTFDDKGRLILGRDDAGLMRLTLNPSLISTTNTDQQQATKQQAINRLSAEKPSATDTVPNARDVTKVEVLSEFCEPIGTLKHCRGVLYAFDSLYVSATNSNGFYRVQDTDGDDRFDTVTLLKAMDYRSRYGHGTNQIVKGPDDMLYVVNGNDVSFPDGIAEDSPYRNPQNDWLLPWPHDLGQDNRVGHILKVAADGSSWTVVAGGFRNQVDVAFSPEGELFTWDADMEWDSGTPWYRPTRLNHVVSGGEYGWRWGTGKWADWYPDSLPTTLDTGLSSPTGLTFAADSRFPEPYRSSLFMADWQNGRILRVTLKPHGASWQAFSDLFLEGAPLNVCDMTFGPDGNLYFITGGRGSQSGLYQVSWNGSADDLPKPEPTMIASPDEKAAGEKARELRRKLETFHGRSDPQAVVTAWPFLGSDDVWLRNAARIAIEFQPASEWREQALTETQPLTALTALLSLARMDDRESQPELVSAVLRHWNDNSPPEQTLIALRTLQLSWIRQGELEDALRRKMLKPLETNYPASDIRANRLTCELLIRLRSPVVLPRTLRLLETAATQEEQIFFAKALTQTDTGWDIESRRRVLNWVRTALGFRGGRIVEQSVRQIRDAFVDSVPESERTELADVLAAVQDVSADAVDEPLVSRPFVRDWQMDELLPDVLQMSGRSVEAGHQALAAAACLKCHRFGERGGREGPDLSQVGKRFDRRAILESILQPSKVIDPKYRQTAYVLTSGKVITGRTLQVSRNRLVIETNPLTGESVELSREDIEESAPSVVSLMPQGLANTLTREEILDLIHVLQSP